MELLQVIGILLSLLFYTFFSGMEMTFLSANRLHIALQSKQGTLSGNVLAHFVKYPSRFIGTTLLGATISLVIYSLLMTQALTPLILIQYYLPTSIAYPVALFLQVLVATGLLLFSAELIAKTIFPLNPEALFRALSLPMALAYGILYLPVVLILYISRFITTKILRLKYSADQPAFRLTNLDSYLSQVNKKEIEETTSDMDTRILNNALEFKDVRVRDCLVPRTEINAVEIGAGMDELKQTFIESGHSKILVYQETIDNVIGYCHSLALFKKPKTIESILTPIIVVPQTMMANELLVRFTTERKSLALVIDEFGGTSGMVTIEDVMEKIFGEIQDEYDMNEDWAESQVDEHTYILSARHEIDYLNEKYDWEIPEGDYETLGGLIIAVNEDLPRIHDVIRFAPFTFTVLSMQDARIDMVKVEVDKGKNPL